MKIPKILLTIALVFSSFFPLAASIRTLDFQQKPHLGHFSEFSPNAHPVTVVYLLKMQQGTELVWCTMHIDPTDNMVNGYSGGLSYIGGMERVRNTPRNQTGLDSYGLSFIGKIGKAATKAIKKNSYEAMRKKLKKKGLSKYFQVHHIFAKQFYTGTRKAFLDSLGFSKNSAGNLISLPTKEAFKSYSKFSKGIQKRIKTAAAHNGGHVSDYFVTLRYSIDEVQVAFKAKKISKSEATCLIGDLQKITRDGLKKGNIKLHNFDTVEFRKDAIQNLMILAIFVGMSEADAGTSFDKAMPEYEEAEREKNKYTKYLTVQNYTGDNNDLAGWSGFMVDMFNPVEDVIFITDLIEDLFKLQLDSVDEYQNPEYFGH